MLLAHALETDQGSASTGPVLKLAFLDHLVDQILHRPILHVRYHRIEVLKIKLGLGLGLLLECVED